MFFVLSCPGRVCCDLKTETQISQQPELPEQRRYSLTKQAITVSMVVSKIPMRPPETRHSLIVRLKDRRNDLAWSEFVCAYEPFLMRLVRSQGTPERHVADVTQQLLISIAKSIDGWKPDGGTASFRRWLGCVARNVVIKFMVRERKQITGEGGSDFLQALTETVDPSIDAELQRQYERELILWASERTRSEFREASWRAFWETEIVGRSISDVATELGVSVGSIYMSRSRIFARIRAMIEEVLNEES